MRAVVLSAEMTKDRGMMSTCVHVRSTGKECALKFTLDVRCTGDTPEKTCEMCDDWLVEGGRICTLETQRPGNMRERGYRV